MSARAKWNVLSSRKFCACAYIVQQIFSTEKILSRVRRGESSLVCLVDHVEDWLKIFWHGSFENITIKEDN